MDLVIGLMSGTSVDGIDAALVRTDGEQLQHVHAVACPYQESTRESIFSVYQNPSAFLANQTATEALSNAIAKDHASAVTQLINQAAQINSVDAQADKQADRQVGKQVGKKNINAVRLLGFHGQTVLHQPERQHTVQLGDAATLAALTCIDTVYNFRAADMRNGGQGAPLAPVYHQCLMRSVNSALPSVFLNIGGVANLTYWDGSTLLGFDTGPGNGLLDQYMQLHFNQPFDLHGQLATQGKVNQELVENFLQRNYFVQSEGKHPTQLQPKSLDRAAFNDILGSDALAGLSAADAMATLLSMTVHSISAAMDTLPAYPKQVVVCGGGQHNRLLMQRLGQALNCGVSLADNLGMSGDFIEAELMALLAARRVRNLPSTYPSTTGARTATVAGDILLA